MNDIISKLNNDELKMFSVKKYEKDAIVFHEGELCESIGIVDTGEIEIVSYNYSGKEIVFTRIGLGMMFGNNLVFSSDPYFKGNVITTKKALDFSRLIGHTASPFRAPHRESDRAEALPLRGEI